MCLRNTAYFIPAERNFIMPMAGIYTFIWSFQGTLIIIFENIY